MRRHLVLALALAALSRVALGAEKSWIFRPSAYTHDPKTGERVNQFAEPAPAYVREDPTYQESGYRHSRWTRTYGDSSDHLHVVETWGQGESIRPYGEWLYPYRPGATPYVPWGYPGGIPGSYLEGPGAMPFGPWANPYGPGQYNGTWGPWGSGLNGPPAPQSGWPQPGMPQPGMPWTGPPTGTPRPTPSPLPSPPRRGGVEF